MDDDQASDPVEIEKRRRSMANALGSGRAEGLEPSEFGHTVLAAVVDGHLTNEEAAAILVEHHRKR